MQRAQQEQWDNFRRNRELQRLWSSAKTFEPTSDALHYQSLGFHVLVDDVSGLSDIMCFRKNSTYQDFIGETDRGISITSKLADVKQAYGEPSFFVETEGGVSIAYKALGLGFSFDTDGRMHQIIMHRPKVQLGLR